MKHKKIIGILSGFLVLTMMLGFSAVAKANDDNDGFKHGRDAHSLGSTLEVHFYDNGKVLVRGAQVTGVSGSTITATTVWGSVNLLWAVNTSSADFVGKNGHKSSVADTAVGDYVSFNGTLATTVANPYTVNATTIKNWSKTTVVTDQKTTLEGKIKTIINNSIPGSLVITANNHDYTVRVQSDTSVLGLLWLKTSLTNFKVGDKIRVYGTVNTDSTVDATVIRDTSI